jgi:hypothetical protein
LRVLWTDFLTGVAAIDTITYQGPFVLRDFALHLGQMGDTPRLVDHKRTDNRAGWTRFYAQIAVTALIHGRRLVIVKLDVSDQFT